MDFLSNLASIALGKSTNVKPLFNSISFQSSKNLDNDGNGGESPIETARGKFYGNNEKANLSENNDVSEIMNNKLQIEEKGSNVIDSEEKNILSEIRPNAIRINEEKTSNPLDNSTNEKYDSSPRINAYFEDSHLHDIKGNRISEKSSNDVHSSIIDEVENNESNLVLSLENKDEEGNKDKFIIQGNKTLKTISQKNFFNNAGNNVSFNFPSAENKKGNSNTVKINIGRVEVKAVYPEQKKIIQPEQRKPELSLDDYLKSFNQDK